MMRQYLWYIFFTVLLLAMWSPVIVFAEGSVQIKSMRLAAVDVGYELNVDAEIELNETLKEALNKGITLYFVTKFTLLDPRWYWFDKEVARTKPRVGLSYHAISRQYRLTYPSYAQNFYSLKAALRALGRVRNQTITIKSELKPVYVYKATLRVWLDLTRMPKPFQIEAFSSNDWNLGSEQLDWHMKLPTSTQPFRLMGD